MQGLTPLDIQKQTFARGLKGYNVDEVRGYLHLIAEEIEDLGKSERDAVRSQIRRIIEHLLKLAYSPAEQPRYDWMHSVADARAALEDKLSPTLRRDIDATLEKLYADGRRHAGLALRTFGEGSPFSLDEICQQDWYPVSSEP